jgi:hypothetical protein
MRKLFVAVGAGLTLLGLGACGPEIKVFAKGGLGNYTADLASHTQNGPVWGVTLNLQPVSLLGVEVGYEGSRNQVNGASPDTALLRNGGFGLLKLSLPLPIIKPFIGLGIGGSYVAVSGASTGGFQNAFVSEIPAAIGVELSLFNLTAGARATYRYMGSPSFATNVIGNTAAGFWDGELTLGLRF